MNRFRGCFFAAAVIAGSAAAWCLPIQAAEVWSPPENPDAGTIDAVREEARRDVRAGRYEVALAKHVWYHNNSLKYGVGQGGVRLSFALGEWMELAGKYPPALERLKAVRDEAGRKAVSESVRSAWQYFHDFSSINRKLGESTETRKLFLQLHKDDPDKAERFYHIAEPVLIRAKDYKLCGKYVDPDVLVPRIIRNYQSSRDLENRFPPDFKQHTERTMTNKSATLVGLLAVNNRNDEAVDAAKKLKAAWDNESYHAAIDDALTGKVPDPWP